MKRLIPFILALCLLVFPVEAKGADGPTLSIADGCGGVGETASLALSFTGTGALSAVSVDIEYDSAVLKFKDFVKGAGLGADYFSATVVKNGTLRISFTDSKSNYNALGPVGYLQFDIIAAAESCSIRVAQKPGTLFDKDYIEIEYDTAPGTLRVVQSFPDTAFTVKGGLLYLTEPMTVFSLKMALPLSVTVDKPAGIIGTGCPLIYEGATYYTVLPGDTDGNGQLTTTDFLQLRSYLMGKLSPDYPHLAAMDTDGNNKHNLSDALQLKAMLAGGAKF